MKKQYKQITAKERDWIGKMHSQGKPIREIARFLERNPSSISREIRRNCDKMFGVDGYFPNIAHRLAEKRRSVSHKRERLKDKCVLQYVKEKLHDLWSPELIAGRLPIEIPGAQISHEAIYQWIYAEAKEFIPLLARRRATRKPRGYSRKPKKHRIHCRIGIEDRPKHIEGRNEVGHWEADTVGVDKHRPTIQVLTERKTRYTKLKKLTTNNAEHSKRAIVKSFSNTPAHLIKSLTYDNGPENHGHLFVNHKLGIQSYFCRPYHSWERGSVENVIGLIRRIYPKKTRFENITDGQVETLQYWLNHRPKKCLGFMTPFEAFKRERCCT